jgi:hypothetical protein
MFVEMREVGVRIDAVVPAGLGEREEIRSGARVALGVDVQSRASADFKGADVVFDSIVVRRHIRMFEEAGQLRPLRSGVC